MQVQSMNQKIMQERISRVVEKRKKNEEIIARNKQLYKEKARQQQMQNTLLREERKHQRIKNIRIQEYYNKKLLGQLDKFDERHAQKQVYL